MPLRGGPTQRTVLIYAYAPRGSRMLAAGNFPQHRVRRHGGVQELFVGVVHGAARLRSTEGASGACVSYEPGSLAGRGAADEGGDGGRRRRRALGRGFPGDELPEELQRSGLKRLAAIQGQSARERRREPGRNPRGTRGLRRARAEGAEQFHRSREPDRRRETRATTRWRSMGSTRSSRDSGGATASDQSWWGCRRDQRDVWGRACGGTGRCGLLQRAGSVGAGRSRHRRARSWGVKASPRWRSTRPGPCHAPG